MKVSPRGRFSIRDIISASAILHCRMVWRAGGKLVNWCFEPSQPLGITSGLRETFIKRYVVEMTNTAEIRPEEQRVKVESCRKNLWNEIHLKGP